ncbi:MAG: hypothetical protein IJ510_02295 [Selenomonadales bacterium]|nr:hypothetical protein [Selenomonadales bacterium]
MKYLRFCLMAIVCFVFLIVPFHSVQAAPERIAILPVQFMAESDARADIAQLVADPISKKFHHSLNNFTKKYEYLTVSDIKQELPSLQSYAYLSDAELIDLADRLNADILLAPIIARCIDRQTYFLDDIIQETYVEIYLIGYERSQDRIIRLADNEQYWGSYATPYTAVPLTQEVMHDLIDELEDSVPAPLINK